MLNKSKLGFFFCVNSIHNPYVNPEIDEHYLSREMGYSLCNIMQKRFNSWYFMHKWSKIKIQVILTSLIYVNWSAKQKLLILKTVGGFICTLGVPFCQPPARSPAIFTISITGFFLWKTWLKTASHASFLISLLVNIKYSCLHSIFSKCPTIDVK